MGHSSEEQLDAALASALQKVEVGARYQHYRSGGTYEIRHLGLIEETEEPCVIYQRVDPFSERLWVRPISNWLEEVEDAPGVRVARFRKV